MTLIRWRPDSHADRKTLPAAVVYLCCQTEHVGMWDRRVCIAIAGVFGKVQNYVFTRLRSDQDAMRRRRRSLLLVLPASVIGSEVCPDSSTTRALSSIDWFVCDWCQRSRNASL